MVGVNSLFGAKDFLLDMFCVVWGVHFLKFWILYLNEEKKEKDIYLFYLLSLSNSHQHAAIAKANAVIYQEKALHINKKVTNVGFVWYPNTLFQPNDILMGTSLSCRKYC